MITYIKGDLFKTDCQIIAHGCNCMGGYGAGIAKIMAMKYPKSKYEYFQKHTNEGWKLGDVQFVPSNNKIIANCATQKSYGGGAKYGKVYADYEAIKTCMEKIYQYSKENNLTVAIPKIGAGLAGGDWNKIEAIINSIFIDKEIKVYYI